MCPNPTTNLTSQRNSSRTFGYFAGNPLPAVVHQVVKQQQLGPGRLLVVGDVHGCFDELQQLLQTVDYKPDSDNLVFVGDLVNKGPKSAEVGVIQSAGTVQRC
jgi:hypothetical protein